MQEILAESKNAFAILISNEYVEALVGDLHLRTRAKKLWGMSALPTLPPIPTPKNRKSFAVNEVRRKKVKIQSFQASSYNPCKTSRPCSHDGLCVPLENGKYVRNIRHSLFSFFCRCQEGFYGKHCELLADKKDCNKHMCQNGGICYRYDGKKFRKIQVWLQK